MKFTKGKSGNPRGRLPGSKNKTTANVKEAMEMAFEGIGGADRLQAWAEKNTTDFYKLWAKLIPVQITGENGGDINITVRKVVHSARDRDRV